MKCKLDENLGDIGCNVLAAAGHDVATVAGQGLSGSDDASLFQVCRTERRVLVTLDRDFGEILRFAPEDSAGIAVLDCRGQLSPSAILARIKELAVVLETESIDGQLWIVEPGRIRVHERRDPR